MALTVLMVYKVKLAILDRKVSKVFKEKSVLRAYRARLDRRVKPDHKVNKVFRARLELLVNKAHKEFKVRQVPRVLKAIRAIKGHRVKLVRKVILEILDQQGLQALREQRELKVRMVFLLIKLLLLMGSSEQNRNG
jgi:hypothetical protein